MANYWSVNGKDINEKAIIQGSLPNSNWKELPKATWLNNVSECTELTRRITDDFSFSLNRSIFPEIAPGKAGCLKGL